MDQENSIGEIGYFTKWSSLAVICHRQPHQHDAGIIMFTKLLGVFDRRQMQSILEINVHAIPTLYYPRMKP